jgi:DNA-binding PadR family transcriptional regulator
MFIDDVPIHAHDVLGPRTCFRQDFDRVLYRHGYGIMREVARQSHDRYRLGSGTLYDNVQKLLDQGIVEESSRRSSADDPRRRYYRLTRSGRRLLATEITRLEGVVREAKLRPKARPEKA